MYTFCLAYSHVHRVSFPNSRGDGSTIQISQDHIPVELKHLIRALLSLNPEARPSCDEILEKIGHLKPKAPNGQSPSPEGSSSHPNYSIARMRLGNALGVHSNQPTAQPHGKPAFGVQTESKASHPHSQSTDAGLKIERIPSDMGYADKVLSDQKSDEDIIMHDTDDWSSDNEGARKRRQGIEKSWGVSDKSSTSSHISNDMSDGVREDHADESEQVKQLLLESPDLPGDVEQQSRLAMRVLALVPDSHRELAEFWMRSASDVDWRKLLKAVSAILKVSQTAFQA